MAGRVAVVGAGLAGLAAAAALVDIAAQLFPIHLQHILMLLAAAVQEQQQVRMDLLAAMVVPASSS